MKKEYRFYGHDNADCRAINNEYPCIQTPKDLYDALSEIWCEYSCAPRLRPQWSKQNMTLGQCSITSFMVQDIFGGEVYGVPLPDGAYHCFNVVGNCLFDLTSEQFGDEVLVYTKEYPQSRESHLGNDDKRTRYEYLAKQLKARCGK